MSSIDFSKVQNLKELVTLIPRQICILKIKIIIILDGGEKYNKVISVIAHLLQQ